MKFICEKVKKKERQWETERNTISIPELLSIGTKRIKLFIAVAVSIELNENDKLTATIATAAAAVRFVMKYESVLVCFGQQKNSFYIEKSLQVVYTTIELHKISSESTQHPVQIVC